MTGPVGGEAGGAANSGSPEGGVQATLFTQDQVNSIAAREKRSAVTGFFKELGFEDAPDAETLKQTLADAGEYKKVKDGEKGDVTRLTDELTAERTKSAKVPDLEATIARQKIAADEQLPTRFWKYIEGKSEDDIKESIKGLKAELGLTDDGDGGGGEQKNQAGQVAGTGARPPAPNQQQGRNNGGGAPGKTLSAGREAYEKKHNKATKE